jgi:hypothetical protein
MKNSASSSVVVVGLVVIAVLVLPVLFRFLLAGGLLLVGLALVGLLAWPALAAVRGRAGTPRETASPDATGAEPLAAEAPTGPQAVEHAREAGAANMRTAWIFWHLRPLPEPEDSPDPRLLTGTLSVVPQADWDVDRLRQHGRTLWALRAGARRHGLLEQVDARLDRVVAMISDLTDDEFDTGLGQANDRYLYHPDREVRTAYLEGGALGLEAIVDAVTASRARAREDAATKAAAESLAQQRNAALRALRETHRPTGARDAHAAWEEQAKRLDE